MLVDDSLVRGTTSGHIVKLLRDVGRGKCISGSVLPTNSPVIGIDTSTNGELIAARMSVAEICRQVGADSLAFLSAAGLLRATGRSEGQHCLACFSGEYVVDVHGNTGKFALEG